MESARATKIYFQINVNPYKHYMYTSIYYNDIVTDFYTNRKLLHVPIYIYRVHNKPANNYYVFAGRGEAIRLCCPTIVKYSDLICPENRRRRYLETQLQTGF